MEEIYKNIWITGASSGIGKELALKFANEGWKVAASARRNNLLIKLPEDKKIRDNALERLQKLIHEKSLLDKKWMVIDLRFPGKIILKSRPSQEKEIESSSDI